jgi:hypothetical protein
MIGNPFKKLFFAFGLGLKNQGAVSIPESG